MKRVAIRTGVNIGGRCPYRSFIVALILLFTHLLSPASATLYDQYLSDIRETPEINLKVDIALEAGDYYHLNDDFSNAKYFYSLALDIGAEIANSKIYAEALIKSADLEENMITARFQYIAAEGIYRELNDHANVALSLERIAWTYDYLEDEQDLTMSILQQAIQIRRALPYSTQLTETMRTLAWFYEVQRNNLQAETLYREAIELDLKNLTFEDIRTILAFERLGIFYIDYGDYNKALQILNRKLKLHTESQFPDVYNIGRTQSMLGWVHLQLKQYSQAEQYYKAALKNINQSITKDEDIPHYYSLPALFDLVYFYVSQNSYIQADPYFLKAKRILEQAGEEDVMDYLNNMNTVEPTEDVIGGFPWSINAQIVGVQAMMRYHADDQN